MHRTRLSTAVAALVAVTVLAGCSSGASVTLKSSPAATTAPASATDEASPNTGASTPPPLTQTFASTIHGISISYPTGWLTAAATKSWTGGFPTFQDPVADHLYDGSLMDHLFVGLASQPLAAKPGDRWAADIVEANDCGPTEPIAIDGAPGMISADCLAALVSVEDRGYLVMLYRSADDPGLEALYDRTWFEQLLATVDLRPEDAVDTTP